MNLPLSVFGMHYNEWALWLFFRLRSPCLHYIALQYECERGVVPITLHYIALHYVHYSASASAVLFRLLSSPVPLSSAALTENDFYRILTETQYNFIMQQKALLKTYGSLGPLPSCLSARLPVVFVRPLTAHFFPLSLLPSFSTSRLSFCLVFVSVCRPHSPVVCLRVA